MKNAILIMALLLALAGQVTAYPAIISSPGVNHTEVKELVYSIHEKHFKGIDSIEFVPNPIRMFGNEYGGMYRVQEVGYGPDHGCFNGKIWIHHTGDIHMTFLRLQHELGHIEGICQHEDYTEYYAWDFQVELSRGDSN